MKMLLYLVGGFISFYVISRTLKINNGEEFASFIAILLMSLAWPLTWFGVGLSIGYYSWLNWKKRRDQK